MKSPEGHDRRGAICEPLEPRSYLAVPAPFVDPNYGVAGKALIGFTSDNLDAISAVALQRDGKVVVAGSTDSSDAPPRDEGLLVVRFNRDGSRDRTFGRGDGVVIIPTGTVASRTSSDGMAIQPDGRIVIVTEGSRGYLFVRLNPDGSLDKTFGPRKSGKAIVARPQGDFIDARALVVWPNGRILAAGNREVSSKTTRPHNDPLLVQLNADGTIDRTFGNKDGIASPHALPGNQSFADLTLLPDGRIIAVGHSDGDFLVARLHASGRVDRTFGTASSGRTIVDFDGDSTAAPGDGATGVVILPDGKLVVGGASNGDFALARLTAEGGIDTAFGTDGTCRVTKDLGSDDRAAEVLLAPDGNLVLAGTTGAFDADSRFAAAKFSVGGAAATAFGAGGVATVDFGSLDDRAIAAAQYRDGRIIIAGSVPNMPRADARIARLTADGQPDNSFSGDGKVVFSQTSPAAAFVDQRLILPDGKVLVVGMLSNAQASFLSRFNADGSPDESFGDSGIVRLEQLQSAFHMRTTVRGDGKIVLSATINEGNLMFPRPVHHLLRFNADGSLDETFGAKGVLRTPEIPPDTHAIAVDSNNRILLASAGDTGGWVIVRITPGGELDFTFGSGGRPIASFDDFPWADPLALKLLADGRIIVAGRAQGFDFSPGQAVFAAARYTNNGQLDGTYGVAGKATVTFGTAAQPTYDLVDDVEIADDGTILFAGTSSTGAEARAVMARLTPAGVLDASFGRGGKKAYNLHVERAPASTTMVLDDYVGDVAVLPSGKILALITSNFDATPDVFDDYIYRQSLVRYNADGSLDTTFGRIILPTQGVDRVPVIDLQTLPDGDVLVTGYEKSAVSLQKLIS